MPLPGLGLLAQPTSSAAPTSATTSTPTTHEIAAGSEWRFEVPFGSTIEVKILSGTAELFGTELALNHTYTFSGIKAAIFTFHGCRLEVSGQCEEYTAEETPMTTYANLHFALENMRQSASIARVEGPRVLVVGPNNSGKTSLVKILTAYANRAGQQPMVVNTDSREGMLSIPSSLTATVYGTILDVEEGWGSSPTSGPSGVPVKLPLCYYYGLPSPEDDPKLFKPVITRLALAATSRLKDDEGVRSTGMIIDTPGVISQGKGGYDIISHIVSEFSVNVILVLGSERLHSDMAKRFDGHPAGTTPGTITVLKLEKSGGCVDRDETYMQQLQHAQIKAYFFGDARRTLSPHTQTVDFNATTVLKITESNPLLMSFLPGGAEDEDASNPLSSASSHPLLTRADPSSQMLHSIFAVMYASPNDSPETIRDASVMGFVYVAEVDEKKKRMRILAPLSGSLAGRPLVWGRWPEAGGSLIG